MELVSGAVWPAEAQSPQPEDTFEVHEQHLDLLALSSVTGIGISLGDIPSHVACALVDGAHHFACGHIGSSAHLEVTVAAVLLTGAIADDAVGSGQ